MPIIINPESEEHWLQLKTEDISSTEISALFNISPYSTPYQVWHEKKKGEIIRLDENNRMTWGKRLEDSIAQGIGEDLGLKVRRLKTYCRHDSCKGMAASFDYEIVGIVDEDGKKLCCTPEEARTDAQREYLKNGPGILEIKNVDFLVYRDTWEEDEAPPHIEAQLQLQLEVKNRSWGIIAPLISGNDMKYIIRYRNKKVGAAMRKKITSFWLSITENNPPEPDFETDADFIIRLYGDANQWVVDVSDDDVIKPLVEQYYDLSMQYKDVTDLRTAVKARILQEVKGNAKKLTCGDITVSCMMTKPSAPTLITTEMVGTEIGGKESYRYFRAFKKKPEKETEALPVAQPTTEIKEEDFVL